MFKKEYWIGFVTGAVAAAVGSILGFTITQVQRAERGYVMSNPAHEARLESLEDLVDQYYLGEIDKEKMANGVYKGLIEGLGDRYSCYYTAEEYQVETEESEGTYEGIGILMEGLEDGTIRIVECIEGSPGSLAGLQKDDIILRLDGKDVTEMELDEVVSYIKNGTTGNVVVLLQRGSGDAVRTHEITVPVSSVEMPSVYTEMLPGNIGYLQILEFKSVTYHQFCDSFDSLVADGMEKLVIDIRDNPGGYVDVVCNILRRILPQGLIVYTEDKYGKREEEFCDGETPLNMPLVVLVNGGSASAAEIFAGAVKDYGIGTIVGTTTYGKGVVQSIRAYPDGSAVKLTTSHYFTPSGTDINEIGIVPDLVLEEPGDETEEDVFLNKAVELLG